MNYAEPDPPFVAPADEPQLRDLFLLTVNDLTFAVFADDVEATSERIRPAALPNAPSAVLGVVSVRGRMMTTLDPLALNGGRGAIWPAELPVVIALRGDEQLALAADSLTDSITIASTDIELTEEIKGNPAVLGIAQHGGKEIVVLDAANLFAAAVQRRERRRRRF